MKFVGSYVQDVKLACIASAVAGHNACFISKPGYGKTEMVRAAAETISGGVGNVFIELDPATPPEVIKGAYNPVDLLNGKISRILTGTPYDPDGRVVILDEFWRANDIVFDTLVHATNRKDINPATRPVFWGTANFVGKADRTEALRDRFAIWLFLDPSVRTKDVIKAHLLNGTGFDPDWATGMPTWQECIDIRSSQPTKGSLELVLDLIDNLATEAKKSGFTVNPRRIVQWSELAYRNAYFFSQTNDFSAIPVQVSKILGWAYPTVEKAESQKWASVCASIVDTIGAAIEAYKATALSKFRAAAAASGNDKAAMGLQLGNFLVDAQQSLCSLVGVDAAAYRAHGNTDDPENPLRGKDPRITQTFGLLSLWFAKAMRGEDL